MCVCVCLYQVCGDEYILCVAGLVQQFGLESILIYTAALLKKRIVVYASSLDSLLKTCRYALTRVCQISRNLLALLKIIFLSLSVILQDYSSVCVASPELERGLPAAESGPPGRDGGPHKAQHVRGRLPGPLRPRSHRPLRPPG